MRAQYVVKSIFITGVALALTIGVGVAAMADWSSSGSGSWSGGGSGSSSQNPKCIASNMNLNLTKADCLKCHPANSTSASDAAIHHKLINTTTPPVSCINASGKLPATLATGCHKPVTSGTTIAFPVTNDCLVCHTSSVHNNVTHCVVYDSCGSCHSGSIPDIHAGRSGTSSGSYSTRYSYHSGSYSTSSSNVSACYLCHTSSDTTVKQTIAKGVAGQTVYCSDCHGGGR